jgi:hypothetical protein
MIAEAASSRAGVATPGARWCAPQATGLCYFGVADL